MANADIFDDPFFLRSGILVFRTIKFFDANNYSRVIPWRTIVFPADYSLVDGITINPSSVVLDDLPDGSTPYAIRFQQGASLFQQNIDWCNIFPEDAQCTSPPVGNVTECTENQVCDCLDTDVIDAGTYIECSGYDDSNETDVQELHNVTIESCAVNVTAPVPVSNGTITVTENVTVCFSDPIFIIVPAPAPAKSKSKSYLILILCLGIGLGVPLLMCVGWYMYEYRKDRHTQSSLTQHYFTVPNK